MNQLNVSQSPRHRFHREARGFALAFAAAAAIAVIGAQMISVFSAGGDGASASAPAALAAAGVCDDGLVETEEQPWVRTELFFGTSKPDGSSVSEVDWRGFLDSEITSRFPDGLTVMSAYGQWQEADETIVQERSKVVVLLYPREFAIESGLAIEEIRTAYETAFEQESVLRADDSYAVCTSF